MLRTEGPPDEHLVVDSPRPEAGPATGVFATIARGALRWRWLVIGGWVAVTLLAVVFLPTLGDVVDNNSTAFLPVASPSLRAAALAAPLVHVGGETGILVAVRSNGAIDAGDQRSLSRLEHAIRGVPGVTGLTSGAVSGNGRAATVVVQFSPATAGGGSAGSRAVTDVRDLMAADAPPDLQTYLTGSLPILVDQQHAADHTEYNVALLSVLVILVVLAVAFRAVLGPLVALAPAGLALMLAEPLIAESTHVGVQISSLLELLLTALVLGAGTDYGLFILFRYRENLGRGLDRDTAIVEAMSRVGGAVGLSAFTVIVALSSLVIARFGLYRGVGPGLALGIVIVLAVEVTLLPALLSLVGRGAFWPSRPGPHWSEPGAWGQVAARVSGRPVVALVSGVLVFGALNPNGTFQDPVELARLEARLGPPQGLPAVEPANLHVRRSAYAAYLSTAQFISRDGRTVLVSTNLSAGGAGTTRALQAIPRVRSVVAGVAQQVGAPQYGVTGEAAGAADVAAVSGQDVVRLVPVVLILLTLLLALGLRSLVAPLYLVASVALSYLASLGLAVLIFQVLGQQIGTNFALPFFLFVFVMALGEDYNILVMGRIREESAGFPPREAVRQAMLATGGTVTAAGLVLAGTFGALAFVTGGQVRQIGTGLALGILLDTFVVRTLLVPASAVLLGRYNWWPSSLWRNQPTEPAAGIDTARLHGEADGRDQPEPPTA